MIGFLIGLVIGAIAIICVPAVADYATQARDWLYENLRGPRE